ncbi:hypothetical protein [Sulfobacillus thermosulfidooxidans]|uniref:hypothetical protein n=1 Tax=Sulfobacillus thermosulfidooxidans TaxID=28034 RepID=UPI0006B6989C|nr:hypothetical protein [Sulfobacillus thermosulfidooxidans]
MMTKAIRFSLTTIIALTGVLTGCGTKTSTKNSASVTDAYATMVSHHNMTSWNVQVIPIPRLSITAIYVGTKASDPTLTIFTKTKSQPQWRRLFTTSSNSKLANNNKNPAINIQWPSNAPQFFGDIKLNLNWSVGGHQYSGDAVFAVKPLKTTAAST